MTSETPGQRGQVRWIDLEKLDRYQRHGWLPVAFKEPYVMVARSSSPAGSCQLCRNPIFRRCQHVLGLAIRPKAAPRRPLPPTHRGRYGQAISGRSGMLYFCDLALCAGHSVTVVLEGVDLTLCPYHGSQVGKDPDPANLLYVFGPLQAPRLHAVQAQALRNQALASLWRERYEKPSTGQPSQ